MSSKVPGAARKKDFQFIKVIGAGSYGKVFLVKHIASKQFYAMKVIKKELVFHTNSDMGLKGK